MSKQRAFKKVTKKTVQVTKCTQEVIDNICNNLRLGSYIETAVIMAGVQKQTFYSWIRASHNPDHPDYKPIYAELRYAVEKAQEEATTRDLLNIDKCAMGQEPEYERYPPGSVDEYGRDISGQLMLNARGNPIIKKMGILPNWNASAWRLERRKPKEWGRTEKLELTGKDGGPINTRNMTDADLEKAAKELEKKLNELG